MASSYEVEITITSAKDLKNINWRYGGLKPYAVVWVDPGRKCSTRVDDAGDTAPYWGDKLTIPFNSPIDDTTLHVDIVHAAAAGEDTKPLIGSARLPLHDVGLGIPVERVLELKRPSGRPQGKAHVSVCVRDPRYRAPDAYYAPPYGVPPPGARDYAPPSYGAPPAYGAPPSGYQAYGAPPSGYQGYGAPPAYGAPPSGYPAYGAPATGYGGAASYGEEKKKSKFGGMGTGLAVGAVAGVLGGLAIAEGVEALEDHVADEAADRVEDDLGYDDGGDDF